MNKLTVKILIVALLGAFFLIFNLVYKATHSGASFISAVVKAKDENAPQNSEIYADNSASSGYSDSPPPTPDQVITTGNSCVVYGPISEESKAIVDMLLQKANIQKLFNTVEKTVFEVYWNLGKDKVNAIKLFEVQKNGGPLHEEKYKLSMNEDGDWIVSISNITDNEAMAREVATNLALKAKKVNAGGRWQYKKTGVFYFYQIDNSAKIPKEVVAVIEKTFSIYKNACYETISLNE